MHKMEEPAPDATKRTTRRMGAWVAVIFWAVQYVELTLANWSADPANAKAYLFPRLLVVMVGIILTFGLVEVTANRSLGKTFARRVLVSIIAVAAASALVGLANYAIYIGMMPVPGIRFDPVQYMYQFFAWSWFFATIAAAMLAMSYNIEARDRERRLAEVQSIAQSAQIRALRYQLNPHFLFNTLNSIAALIAANRVQVAEHMVENLSDFLRTSLELDPFADITLADELELQSLYLEIEALRFPERLAVETDIPSELELALVPSLITQPLIENAVKYGVARSRQKVTLLIRARAEGESLILTISNSAFTANGRSKAGTGLGLANVTARLQARFGEDQSLSAEPKADGAYEVKIRMPLRVAERPQRGA